MNVLPNQKNYYSLSIKPDVNLTEERNRRLLDLINSGMPKETINFFKQCIGEHYDKLIPTIQSVLDRITPTEFDTKFVWPNRVDEMKYVSKIFPTSYFMLLIKEEPNSIDEQYSIYFYNGDYIIHNPIVSITYNEPEEVWKRR